MAPGLSFITVCKGRLEHLRKTLPSLAAQPNSETIVVDYDCPDGTAEYVLTHYPTVRVVKVKHRPEFNNWEGRNLGATAATGNILAFIDADTVLSNRASEIALRLLTPSTFLKMPAQSKLREIKAIGDGGSRIGSNQIAGLMVVRKDDFDRVGGYDQVLRGWGTGGDLDLVDNLIKLGRTLIELPVEFIEECLAHTDDLRMKYHVIEYTQAVLSALAYRVLRNQFSALKGRPLSLGERKALYEASASAVARSNFRERKPLRVEVPYSRTKYTSFGGLESRSSIVIDILFD